MNKKEPSEPAFQALDPWKSKYLEVTRRNLPHLQVRSDILHNLSFEAELSPAARDVVLGAILACDQKSVDLEAAAVMPDHVHVIFRLIQSNELSRVLQSIKSRSARHINQLFKNEGSVWKDESFDHIIRHAAELEEKREYIAQNPVRKGLAGQSFNYKWLLLKSNTG